MSDPKRPAQGNIFDYDKEESFGGSARASRQPQSLFGEYTPPTPRQGAPRQTAPAQGQPGQGTQPTPQRPVRPGGVGQPQGAPREAPQGGQPMPGQPTQRLAQQTGQPLTHQQQIARQQAARQGALQRPAAPGTPQGQRPPAPGAPAQNAAQARPAQPAQGQRMPAPGQGQPRQPVQPQGQAGRQPAQRPGPAQSANGATQVIGNPAPQRGAPAGTATPNAGQTRVLNRGQMQNPPHAPQGGSGGQGTPSGQARPGDSGQRLSQFAPRPAAEQANGPAHQPGAAPQNGHTRVLGGQPGAQAGGKPFAGFEDATRVGQAVNPHGAQATMAIKNAVDHGYDNPPAGGGGNGNGGRGGNGGKNGKGKGNGKPGGRPAGKTVAKYVFFNVCKFALTCLCIGLIIASILFVQVASYVVESTANDDLTLDLNAIASSQTGYMWAKDGNGEHTIEYLQIVGETNFRWADLSGISPYVIDALISTEDKSFYEHGGVSWSRTAYAAVNEVVGITDKQFGASTITQQLVKNLTEDKVVTDAESGATAGYLRKLREIFRAIGINNNYSKEMVLEAYLNTMPLTGTIVGVGAGAYEYFGKTPAELELHEAAMIVGITNWPTKYSPYSKPENCLERRNDVLYFMYQDEKITKSQFDEACAKDLGLVSSKPSTQDQAITTWYADAAIDQVIEDLAEAMFEGDRTSASTYFYNAGLNIELNVDLATQKSLEEMYRHAYEEDSPFPDVSTTLDDGTVVRPQSAMTIMDYEGNVLASVGGTGEKTVSRALNRACMSPRQVGSTMKGVANYVLGLEYNLITYSTNIVDEKCWYASGQASYSADGTPKAYDWPTNYADKITNSPMGVYTAFAQSTNTVAVRVGLMVGPEEMFDFAYYTMGLTHLDEVTDMGMSSLVLGGQSYGATTEEMAAAYAIYGNGGQYHGARYYSRVLDSQGNVVLRASDYTIQAVSEETAYIMNRLLYNVVNMSGGTANGMGVEGFETIGKTGTTSDDNDRWFVGLTPYYVAAIWWGYDSDHTLYGYSPAASTNGTTRPWKYVMDEIHEGLEPKDFPEKPEGVKTEAFCRDTGLLAGEQCGNRGTGYYKLDNIPDVCMGHSDTGEEPVEA